MLGYVFGKLSAANWRLSPIVGTGIVLTLLVLRWGLVFHRPALRIPALLAVPIVVLSFLNLSNVSAMPADSYKDNELYQLADSLKERELSYGYASFWRSNALTVIAGPDIKVRTVEIDEEGVTPRYYQTQRSWYRDQPGQEEYFLLVNQSEYNTLVNNGNPLLAEAQKQEKIELASGASYYILIFEDNIWD